MRNSCIREKIEKEGENKDDVKKVEMLLKAGADVNVKSKSGRNLLQKAVSDGKVETVKLLLAHGADVHVRDSRHKTPLHCAAVQSGRKEILQLLIQAGGNVKTKNKWGYTPLHGAPTVEIIKLLLASGADVNAKADNGETPLDSNLKTRSKKELNEVLVANGAKINTEGNLSRSPFYDAVKNRDAEKVRLLLRAGTHPYVDEVPILLYAVLEGSKEVLRAVIDFGHANINQTMHKNTPITFCGVEGNTWTALHIAAVRGNKDIYDLLVGAGADKEKKYDFRYDDRWMWESQSPMGLAIYCRNKSIYDSW